MNSLSLFSPLLRDTLFDQLAGPRVARDFHPALDISEGDTEYVIRMDIPGVKQSDLAIEVKDDILTIRGHREWAVDGNANGISHLERAYGTFSRSLRLPQDAEEEIDAALDEGVLTLTIPKAARTLPKTIEVKSGDEKPELEGVGA